MENQGAYVNKFNEHLDRTNTMVSIANIRYPVSKVLERVDPVRYTELFDEWFKQNNNKG